MSASRTFANLLARDVHLDQTAVANLLANHVTFDRQSFAGVVIARRVDGNVRTLVDWRGALAVAGVAGAGQRADGGPSPPLTAGRHERRQDDPGYRTLTILGSIPAAAAASAVRARASSVWT